MMEKGTCLEAADAQCSLLCPRLDQLLWRALPPAVETPLPPEDPDLLPLSRQNVPLLLLLLQLCPACLKRGPALQLWGMLALSRPCQNLISEVQTERLSRLRLCLLTLFTSKQSTSK